MNALPIRTIFILYLKNIETSYKSNEYQALYLFNYSYIVSLINDYNDYT